MDMRDENCNENIKKRQRKKKNQINNDGELRDV